MHLVQWLGHRLDGQGIGVPFPAKAEMSPFFIASRLALGAQTASCKIGAEVRRFGLQADELPPPSVNVKNSWNYISTPPYIFMTWCLITHRNNFTILSLPYSNFRNITYQAA
jgi:hypothetical protein